MGTIGRFIILVPTRQPTGIFKSLGLKQTQN